MQRIFLPYSLVFLSLARLGVTNGSELEGKGMAELNTAAADVLAAVSEELRGDESEATLRAKVQAALLSLGA